MGVAEYIRKKRLEYACSMLKSGELSVAEVSEKAGFSDYNYFSRLFKKHYGVSPHKKFG
ncbi:MAG: AraC family transcriptional regulator [Clostridiales bacterium]|nr:AraC family transcriptional regulator [Clostridiales bacterium]